MTLLAIKETLRKRTSTPQRNTTSYVLGGPQGKTWETASAWKPVHCEQKQHSHEEISEAAPQKVKQNYHTTQQTHL